MFPINPLETNIQGDPCFPNLSQLRPWADAVIIAEYVDDDEDVGIATLNEMMNLRIFRVWIDADCASDAMRHFYSTQSF